MHDKIKYTWEWSYSKVVYLDVMVEIKNNQIVTDVYSKPKDTHQIFGSDFMSSEACETCHTVWSGFET